MEKLLLVGAGGFGRVVLEHASALYDCAFLDDGDATNIDGVSVIGKTGDMASFYPEYSMLLVTIGNNRLREQLYKEAAAIGYTFPSIIHPTAYVSSHAHIGNGCVILNNAVVQNNATCGDGCILNPGVELHHDSAIGSCCLIYTNSVVRSLTHVGDRVWIGSTATVSTSAVVPDDMTIGDGEVFKARRYAISGWRKTVFIFLLSIFATLAVLYTGNAIAKYKLHQKMVLYSASTTRESDGAPNRVIMIGRQGYLGYSSVRLQYFEDGWISLVGDNVEESDGWKLLSKFTLEPGSYTLTGLEGMTVNTIALQLRVEDNTGYYHYYYQYNEDVSFNIERSVDATLHVRVYPGAKGIAAMAQPAVYRDE